MPRQKSNHQWLDVLERGPASRFAHWFDINWSPRDPSLMNKVLVPFLGTGFDDALRTGRIELRHDKMHNSYAVWLEGTHKLPVRPQTYDRIGGVGNVAHLNSPEGRADIAQLIGAQHWRPARYSVAADEINYRRFFIVSDLAAIRIEDDAVFDAVHRLTFDLVEAGLVEGLRVDHIDGLLDPKAYCLKLRAACPRPVYLVVEKILAPHETLRQDWQVDGTTGYEFSSAIMRLLTDPAGETPLTRAEAELGDAAPPLAQVEHDSKIDIMDVEMAAELDGLSDRLHALAMSHPASVDFSRNSLRHALMQIIAALPVYRTYFDGGVLHAADRRNIALAVARACEAAGPLDPAVFRFVGDLMAGDLGRPDHGYDAARVLDLVRRVQQYTGPVMAKGLEDTALYRYNRLLALGDVGERPDRFTLNVAAFHDFNRRRLRDMPLCMLTTSSHDTKRGEDTRARIAGLSGFAPQWQAAVRDWRQLLAAAGAPVIADDDSYVIFQLLLGAWPAALPVADASEAALSAFRDRLDGAMRKALREARLRSNWAVPHTAYEQKVSRYIEVALTDPRFLAAFGQFESQIAPYGAQNGLTMTVLKLTVPGVPDIYQGAEFWEQSMVDPDNRRPVDYAARQAALERTASWDELVANWRDGRVKQRSIARLLALRRERPLLFSHGSYEPIDLGPSICAFSRTWKDDRLLVASRLRPWQARNWDDPAWSVPSGLHAVLGDADTVDRAPFAPQLPVAVFVN